MADPTIDEQIASELASSPTTNPDAYSYTTPDGTYAQPGVDESSSSTPVAIDGSALPAAPQPTAVNGKVDVSRKGFGADRGQGVLWQKGMDEYRAEDAQVQAQAEGEKASEAASYGELGSAQLDHGAIQSALYQEQSKLLDKQQQAENDFANLDRTMYAESKAETAQYLDAYKQQLAAVRQMTIVSPQSTLSKWQAGGMSMAMFAQGFLAARGIHIDVTDQVDRWVQQSLHEQEANIQNARANANDSLNLYQIAKQSSQDDLEAMHRYRGMVIEAMKTGIDAAAMRFQAPLALSQANVAKAQLDVEQTKSLNAINDRTLAARIQIRREAADEIHKRVMERMEEEKIGIEAMKVKASQKATKRDHIVYDPATNQPAYKVLANDLGADKKVEEVTKADGDYKAIDAKIKDAISFKKKADLGSFGKGSLLDNQNEAKRVYKEQVANIASVWAHSLFGSQQTEQEMAKIEQMMPFEKWYQSGGNDRVWANVRENIRKDYQGAIESRAHAIDPNTGELMEDEGIGNHRTLNAGVKNDSDAALFGEAKKASPGEQAVGEINAKGTNRDRGAASGFFKKFGVSDRPGEALDPHGSQTMPGNYVAADMAARVALEPENFISAFDLHRGDKGVLGQMTKQYTDEAVSSLNRMYLDTDDVQMRNYLGKLLDGIKNDPEGTLKLLNER